MANDVTMAIPVLSENSPEANGKVGLLTCKGRWIQETSSVVSFLKDHIPLRELCYIECFRE